MSGRTIWMVAAVIAGVAAQAMLGWWALALVAFMHGVAARNHRWPSLTFGAAIALSGAGLLAWLAWTGQPVAEMRRILGELTGLPVVTLSILLPAAVAASAAYVGAAVGRRFLFG